MKVTKNSIVTNLVTITKNKNEKEINYDRYSFSKKELVCNILAGCIGVAVISKFFYDSAIVFILLLPCVYLYLLIRRDELCKRRKKQLEREFRDVIMSVSANIQAGYSVENAFCESYRDINMLYGTDSIMAKELYLMMRKLRNNEQLEDIIMNLGDRSGVRDIHDFADVFRIAKRNGGSLQGVIDNTVYIIEGKYEVAREIETVMSDKRMEQLVMQVMPFGMMGYLSLTSPGFFDGLYHNIKGVLIMSVCLGVYAAASLLAVRILDIEV